MNKELRENLVSKLTTGKDNLIKEAISHSMGREDWSLDEVVNRGEFRSYQQIPDVEEFCFDGVPLLEFHYPKFEMEQKDDFTFAANAGFKYRKLYGHDTLSKPKG